MLKLSEKLISSMPDQKYDYKLRIINSTHIILALDVVASATGRRRARS